MYFNDQNDKRKKYQLILPKKVTIKMTIVEVVSSYNEDQIALVRVKLNSDILSKVSYLSLVDEKNVVERGDPLKVVSQIPRWILIIDKVNMR